MRLAPLLVLAAVVACGSPVLTSGSAQRALKIGDTLESGSTISTGARSSAVIKFEDGQVMALLMMCYAVHRTLNEVLRDDVRPVGFESYSSYILFAGGALLMIWATLRFRQRGVVVAILRREMGVMAVAAAVVAGLMLRASLGFGGY